MGAQGDIVPIVRKQRVEGERVISWFPALFPFQIVQDPSQWDHFPHAGWVFVSGTVLTHSPEMSPRCV